MLPAPASTAAPPRPRSRASWNPAVPPPPVAGAAVGSGLDGLGVGDGEAVRVTVGVGDGEAVRVTVGVADADAVRVTVGVAEGDTDLLADGVGLALGERVALLLVEVATVGEAGENVEDGAARGLDPDPEQADIATEASMVMLLQPMTANLALSPGPAMVVRTFMEPPHALRQVGTVSGSSTRNRDRKGKRMAPRPLPALSEDRSPKLPTPIKVNAPDSTDTR
jgi:hypothetical protein